MAARRDTSLSRRQPAKGGTKASTSPKLNKDQGQGKMQPTLRTLDSPNKGLGGPVAPGRGDVKVGANPKSPLVGPVNKVYTPDKSFFGDAQKQVKRQRGKKLK
jgi:hypothetical protein